MAGILQLLNRFFCTVRFLVILFLCAYPCFGQVLDNREGIAFTDKPFFNQEFVKQNKLKELKGEFSYMKSGKGLVPMKFYSSYTFDEEGHLVATYETRPDDGTKDTSWNRYFYNAKHQLTRHQITKGEGLQSTHYTYDSLGRVIKEVFTREIDSNGEELRSLKFNEERIEYFQYDQQLKRTRYNNYDLPYLDEFYNYNDLGYLVERIERVKMTSTVYTYKYEYNENGKLSAVRKSSNKELQYVEEWLFQYDELGNLTEKLIYRNGTLKTNIQIIYNQKTNLLESVITTEEPTGFMMVLRFRDYEFYEN